MNLKPLLLAPTIRTATEQEIPKRKSLLERLELRQHALVVEGFVLKPVPSAEVCSNFFSEINIDNHRLWCLFKSLMMVLPEQVSLIYHHIDDDAAYSPYMDKFEMLNHLDPYQRELSMDGFLEFGLIFQDDDRLIEIFVKKAKYIQFWGMDEASFRKIMEAFDLFEIEGLNFIDEFPLVTDALNLHHPDLVQTRRLLEIFTDF